MAHEIKIPAGEFKATCLKLMDEVHKQKTHIVITKRGRPIAKLVPVETVSESLFGCMKGTGAIIGDIISPVDTEWETDA